MPRNTVASKAAAGPANTFDGEITTVLTPRRSSQQLMLKLNGYANCLKPETPLYMVMSRIFKDSLWSLRPCRSALADLPMLM